MSGELYYSRMGNNQFSKSPIEVPRLKFCDAMERFFKKMSKDFAGKSNLPDKEPYCPLEKVYFIVFKLY